LFRSYKSRSHDHDATAASWRAGRSSNWMSVARIDRGKIWTHEKNCLNEASHGVIAAAINETERCRQRPSCIKPSGPRSLEVLGVLLVASSHRENNATLGHIDFSNDHLWPMRHYDGFFGRHGSPMSGSRGLVSRDGLLPNRSESQDGDAQQVPLGILQRR